MFKTHVPLKDSHVRDFIVSRYGNGNTTIIIDRRTLFGKAVELGCSKIGYLHSLPRQKEVKECDCITLLMPEALKNDYMQPAKVVLLSDFFGRLFTEFFLIEISVLVEGGLSDYDAVAHYIRRYNINDEGRVDEKLRKKWRDHQSGLRKKFAKFDEK